MAPLPTYNCFERQHLRSIKTRRRTVNDHDRPVILPRKTKGVTTALSMNARGGNRVDRPAPAIFLAGRALDRYGVVSVGVGAWQVARAH